MKKALYWIFAIIITFIAVIYQRTTGPTYDKKIEATINDSTHVLKLVRSIEIGSGSHVNLNVDDQAISAKLYYKRYPSKDAFQAVDFVYDVKPVNSWLMNKVFTIYEEKGWFAPLPEQAPAGKIEYYFEITDNNGTTSYAKDQPIVIRYKGAVPAGILIPHIFFMFFAMFLGNLAGIMAAFRNKKFKLYTTLTIVTFFIGGMILGPMVQWHAFGEAWAGVPFAWDLTDNKTLIAFLSWLLAFAMNRNKERPVYTVVAALVMLLVYSIPHSMYGSELDPETGEIIQGWIQLFLIC